MAKKTQKKKMKKYIVPALASAFIAGFGQILKGDSKKGLKIMLWFYFGLPIAATISMTINTYLFLIVLAMVIIIYPVVWAYNIIDAFIS
ncbi:hypothetical protein ACFL4F_02815 [Candidatus Margulisiibacteriota bacterium]